MYAPDDRRRELVERLLEVAVAPGGRLFVCGYGGDPSVQGPLRAWGYEPVYEDAWTSPRSGKRVELAAIRDGAAAAA